MKLIKYGVLLFSLLIAQPLLAQVNNSIIFVTQPPLPEEFATINSSFGNHSPDIQSSTRGGDLYIRYPNGNLKNLTQAAGYGHDGLQGENAIAVRDPAVHWSGEKVIFSMIIGAPRMRFDERVYRWQLYEITRLGESQIPIITKVTNQPEEYNNVMPTYGSQGQIFFSSDRPINNQVHLYPQLDEYDAAPSNTGLWSLDPSSGKLFLLEHSPSGSFDPIVDSFGRVIFTRWDHLVRDQNTSSDIGLVAIDYPDESQNVEALPNIFEIFPEPLERNDPDLDPFANPHDINHFFPWMIAQDGTGLETLNHIGRQELFDFVDRALTDDPNLEDFFDESSRNNQNSIENIFQITEDPSNPGLYLAINAPFSDTHTAGQIITLNGEPSRPADQILVRYLTHPETARTTDSPSPNHTGFYRDPLPTSDGLLIASHTAETKIDINIGNRNFPRSRYDFRIKTLTKNGAYYLPQTNLTPGIRKNISYWDSDELVTYNNVLMWELQAVELTPKVIPQAVNHQLPQAEQNSFTAAGVDIDELKEFLEDNNLALFVTRDVTSRDLADIQQPFNIKIAGSNKQRIGKSGKIYEVSDLQLFEGSLTRAYRDNPGRRAITRLLRNGLEHNPSNPGGPPSSIKVAADGSLAAFVPAKRALSWQLTDPNHKPVIRERFWLSFQPGEIRVCASCHGVNSFNQEGGGRPTNTPQALTNLLSWWKTLEPPRDTDNDGLMDSEEERLGTNPNLADTDGDGVDDAQEVSDGSNPLDSGSRLVTRALTLCSEWNGFLGGMWNILEHVNFSSSPLQFNTKLYDINGRVAGDLPASIANNAQTDVLVHDMSGWQLNSFGKVCSTATNASPGDLDGRMVYYKRGIGGEFEFAFAIPFADGRSGNLYVPFNTFQPSFSERELTNFVANWIQLTNFSNNTQNGRLVFYDLEGRTLANKEVNIPAGARMDFSGHQFGKNRIGTIEWSPNNQQALFQLRNVRYFYDNPNLEESFSAAFQLEGLSGNGEPQIVPLDTENASSIVEITNTLSQAANANVRIYDTDGQLLSNLSFVIPAKGSRHIIADGILNNSTGSALVSSSNRESLIVTAMQYGREDDGSIAYIYGIQGKQALGNLIRGSYNTFLNQECFLRIQNPNDSDSSVKINAVRHDGTKVIQDELIPVTAHGIVDYDLCSKDRADVYGTVSLELIQGQAITANVIRVGPEDSYLFPTELRQ